MSNTSKAYTLKTKSEPDPFITEFGVDRKRNKYDLDEKVYAKFKEAEAAREKGLDVRDGETTSYGSLSLGNLSLPHQAWESSGGEYIRKPYDEEKLVDIIEISGRLKTCVEAVVTSSVGLGLDIKPYGHPNINKADLTEEEEEIFKQQRLDLINWSEGKVQGDEDFSTICEILQRKRLGMGNCYLEVIQDPTDDSKILEIRIADPRSMWVGAKKDRYVQIKDGKRTYFRPFNESNPVERRASDFKPAEEGEIIPVNDRATKIIHFKNFNLVSDTYGVPDWTPVIPDILGDRAASERNKAFFDNDATPRMAVTVSGGALTEETIETMQDYFTMGKGFANAHRILILECSSVNVNSPDWKPPKIDIKPLTVGQTDDASFMGYSKAVNEKVRETFRIASIFLGNSEDINRAAAFTMREMTVNLTFIPEGHKLARLLNKTLLNAWMLERGLDSSSCKVQYGFKIPSTMSQKDKAAMYRELAAAGALSPNDIRTELGLDTWDAGFASVPTALAIVMMQMSLLNTPSADDLVDTDEIEENPIPEQDENTKSMVRLLRKFNKDLSKMFSNGDTVANEAISNILATLYQERTVDSELE